jgi:hypothetical protein
VAFLTEKESIMKSKEFYEWLHTSDADYYDTEVVGDGVVVVTFADIEFPSEEEIEAEERKDALKQSIKALEDILEEPYVLQGNAVQLSGKLYVDTRLGLMNALEIIKGETE